MAQNNFARHTPDGLLDLASSGVAGSGLRLVELPCAAQAPQQVGELLILGSFLLSLRLWQRPRVRKRCQCAVCMEAGGGLQSVMC